MKQSVVALFVFVSWFSSIAAHAGIISFTDRSLFESYINDFVVDEFNDINLGPAFGRSRAGYSWTMNDYGCVNSLGCTSPNSVNPFVGNNNNWIWTYGSGSFNFNFGITAFGFDYVNPYNSNTAQLGLNTMLSGVQSNGAFFGIASTDGSYLPAIAYLQSQSFMGFDNLTYSITANGSSTPIPEPWPLAVFALALVMFTLQARKKRS